MSRALGWQVNGRGAAGLWLNMSSEESDTAASVSPTAVLTGRSSERVGQGRPTASGGLTVPS